MLSKTWKPSPLVKELFWLLVWNLLVFLALSAVSGNSTDPAGVYGSI